MAGATPSVPRGRHAPPLEVRLQRQRARLLEAAAAVFARCGYAEASAEAISREAGMSKATFYEHFANKEECILALFDVAAGMVRQGVVAATEHAGDSADARWRASIRAFLEALAVYPDAARTLLVEIIGAGPRATERRDAIVADFAQIIDEQNRLGHDREGRPRLKSPLDAIALVGAIIELASRQLRYGDPADPRDLEPVIERLITGILLASE
jgi:AcrR family transcriptional regulator